MAGLGRGLGLWLLDGALTSFYSMVVSHWTFNDDGSGPSPLDSKGGNTLTAVGAPVSEVGILNTCADLERGSTQYFTIADNAALSSGGKSFGCCGWFNAESITNFCALMSKYPGAGNREWVLFVGNAGTEFRIAMSYDGTNATTVACTSPTTATATWFFIIFWYDKVANTVNIQVNGGTVFSGTLGGSDVFDGNGAMLIGNDAAGNLWDGLIDSVTYFNGVPTAAQRAALYNAGAGKDYPFAGV